MKLLIVAITMGLFLKPGSTYIDETCSQFVCRRANQPEFTAQEFWDGGEGRLQVVQAQPQFEDVIVKNLREGDVIAFHGVHVAVYTHGAFVDSTPEHGVGRLQYRTGDPWYAGPVRVLRWQNDNNAKNHGSVHPFRDCDFLQSRPLDTLAGLPEQMEETVKELRSEYAKLQ
jgi:hypothetical protein